MDTLTMDPCQLRLRDLSAPMGRAVLEAPVWPNDLRGFAEHADLCVHAVLPAEPARWGGLFTGVRALAGRTAHVRIHVQPARGGFTLDPTVLILSRRRRHREALTAVMTAAATAGVELTPPQVIVEPYSRTRAGLRLPQPSDHAAAWGVISVAWFPLARRRGPAPALQGIAVTEEQR
ncbi:hypothetical protein ACFUTX_00080 [Microbacterium sp. NPDC057407]|uniref:hypothetical protein n=1 Tax=Microbacterium sp. NPDC057407 TaxID=3346120 RepID=UPI003670E02A